MNFGPDSKTVKHMIGAAMVRKMADYLALNNGCSHAIKLLDDIWLSYGISLNEF